MAVISRKWCLVSALVVLISVAGVVKSESAEVDDEATVEIDEDDQYHSPQVSGDRVYLAEHFDDENAFKKKWIKSEAKKQGVDENIAKYDGRWEIQAPARKIFKNDFGLVLTTEAKHAAISTLLDKPFEFKDKPLIVQYEVTMQEGQNCGGAYIKLLSRGTNTKADLRKFHDQTPYTIMFGPDKCGNDNKLHFIFRHQNPKNGTIEEKHSKKPSQRLDDIYKDKEPHLYTLVVKPDNTFTVHLDNKEVNSGSLLEDFAPPVNPPEEIDDPNDKKPEDWDEREKIVDPTASKPEDWDEDAPAQIVDPNAVKPDGWLDDEPEMVPDPDAQKPEDWDDDMDGEWEPPLIDNPRCASAPGCGEWKPPTVPNPNYKGIWRAPLIPNPNYKGKWSPRRIPNPDYFRDDHPFKMTPIHAVGFELWSMSPLLLFDNLIVTDDVSVAEHWAAQSFAIKRAKMSRDSRTLYGKILRAMDYKPGYWAIYITYVAIPIGCYVYYLVRTAREESLLERSLQYLGENPWLYAVLIIGSFILVGGIAYLCCGSRHDSYAEMKKTDAMGEEDPHQSEGEGEADADVEPEADADEEQKDEPQEKASKADLEGPAPEPETIDATPEDAPAEVPEVAGAGDGHRRRKPRKE